MTIIKRKPTSPGRRHVISVVDENLYKGKPFAPLLVSKSKTGGRNNKGRITCRHKGGGHKQQYRFIDFKRNKDVCKARVERLEYDPNRSAHIALLLYEDGERKYIVAPKNLKVNDIVSSGYNVPIQIGNTLPLSNIPLGTVIHCIELKPKKGAQLVRSAGSSAQLIAKENDYATIRLRSQEVRKVPVGCRATIGQVGNVENSLRKLGKAGANRWRGVRPTVRGVAMNPIDHPHGGGEGKTSGGRHPVSPWGTPSKGYKTRHNKRTNYLIVRRKK